MGEKFFSLWCTAANITANKSTEDETGWDCYIEFPFMENPILQETLDMQKSPIECKIQIKSTNSNSNNLQISLSVLHRLVKSPLPAFILILMFNNQDEPQTAYLIHIDKEIISKTLRKIRELSIKNSENLLNKRTITFNYKDYCGIKNPNAHLIKESILEKTGYDLNNYIVRKLDLIKTTGFKEGFGFARMTFDEANHKKMQRALLGYETTFEVENFNFYNKRFDIVDQKPSVSLPRGTATLGPALGSEVYIVFQKDKFSEQLVFNCHYFSNHIIADTNPKIRILCEVFDLEIDFGDLRDNKGTTNLQFRFCFDMNTFFSISDLIKVVNLFTLLQTKICITVNIGDANTPQKLLGYLHPKEVSHYIYDFFEVIHQAKRLFNFIEANEITQINLNTLNHIKDDLFFIDTFLMKKEITLEYDINDDVEPIFTDQNCAFIFYRNFNISGYWLAFFTTLTGQPKKTDGKITLTSAETNIDFKTILKEKSNITLEDLKIELEKIESNYAAKGTHVVRFFDSE